MRNCESIGFICLSIILPLDSSLFELAVEVPVYGNGVPPEHIVIIKIDTETFLLKKNDTCDTHTLSKTLGSNLRGSSICFFLPFVACTVSNRGIFFGRRDDLFILAR